MTAQPPRLPFRTETLKRIEAFKLRRPDILITPWYDSASRKWETTEPGQQQATKWASATAMMDHLEAAYPTQPAPAPEDNRS